MENQIEKSIEQVALENYAFDKAADRYRNIGIVWGIIIGVLIAIICKVFLFSNEPSFIEAVFLSLFIGGLCSIISMVIITFTFWGFYMDKGKAKLIQKLSQEESKKIISDYLQKEIKSWQDNIPYCEKEIEKLQTEIEELKEEIEDANEKIPELQEKLNYLSSRGV